jgi:hypothetical protein
MPKFQNFCSEIYSYPSIFVGDMTWIIILWYKIENSAVIDPPERIMDIVSKYINFESLFQNRGT